MPPNQHPLTPPPHGTPAFAQLYIFDSNPERQADVHMSHHRSTDGGYLLDRDRESSVHNNPYVLHVYQTAMERWAAGDNIRALRIKMADTSHLDRRYNRPTASEIAVILPGTGEEVTCDKGNIVVQLQNGPLRRVSEWNSNYCAQWYPMIFPSGEPGWHENMFHINSA